MIIFKKIALIVALASILAGCWKSEDDLFSNAKGKIITDVPQEMLVSFGGKSEIVTQKINDLGEKSTGRFESKSFEDIRFLEFRHQYGYQGGVLVQGKARKDGLYYYAIVNPGRPFYKFGNAVPAEQNFRMQAVFPLGSENAPKEMSGLAGLIGNAKDAMALTANYQGFVEVSKIDGDSSDEIDSLQAQAEQRYAEGRYERAVRSQFLELCRNRTLIFGGDILAGLLSSLSVQGDQCVINNGIVEIRLKVTDVFDVKCTGSNSVKSCGFTYSVWCYLQTAVANNDTLNDSVCNAVSSFRQPVIAQVVDDGLEVKFSTFEQQKP